MKTTSETGVYMKTKFCLGVWYLAGVYVRDSTQDIIQQKVLIHNIEKRQNLQIKGTVSVISSDSPCKDGNSLLKCVLLKALSD